MSGGSFYKSEYIYADGPLKSFYSPGPVLDNNKPKEGQKVRKSLQSQLETFLSIFAVKIGVIISFLVRVPNDDDDDDAAEGRA